MVAASAAGFAGIEAADGGVSCDPGSVDGTGVMLALAPGLLPGGKGGRGGILVSLRIFLERASGTAGPDMVVTKLLWEPGIK